MGSIGLTLLVINALTCLIAVAVAEGTGLDNPYGMVAVSCVIIIGSVAAAIAANIWKATCVMSALSNYKARKQREQKEKEETEEIQTVYKGDPW